MRRAKKQEANNDYIYMTILTLFIVMGIGTFFHDPILHSIAAYLNGWSVTGYETDLMTGSTTAIAPKAVSAMSLWFYYMFPALFIFIFALIIIVLKPYRLLIIGGRVLIALNLASLNPQIKGSDAYEAAQALIAYGWTESGAYMAQYALLFLIIVVWGLYEYIGTENNMKDAQNRASNILH